MATRFGELLAVLSRNRVEYILVGGLAAVVHGAPVATLDVDIVYARTPENISRLLVALSELEAVFRDPRRLVPNASHLESLGHKLLHTKYGPLDVLGSIEEQTTYEDLVSDSETVEVAGFEVRVLSLERLIRVKEQLKRPKDQLMLLQLRATLEERGKQK